MYWKKRIALIAAAACILAMTSCASQTPPPESAPAGDEASQQAASESAPASESKEMADKITFWHSMGGVNGQVVDTVVENFNNSQDKIKVTAEFQGSYEDALTKLKVATQGNAGPDVIQVYDLGTRFMVDSGWTVPIQDLAEGDDSIDLSSIEPALVNYYTVDGKLQSMPFNASTPLLYYNKDAFAEAGLDPEKPPASFAELYEYSEKLVKKDDAGKTEQYGFSMAVSGWYFEEYMAKVGLPYLDNGNGRQERATAVAWDSGEAYDGALAFFTEWKKLVDSGVAVNTGRGFADTRNSFTEEKVAMIFESTASLRSLLDGIGGKFELGTAFLPDLTANDKGGAQVAGACVWVIDNDDDARKNSAWELVKYFASAETQAFWSQSTGYFPITADAYEVEELKTHIEKYPQFNTAIDQLHQSPEMDATAGGLCGVFSEARVTIEQEVEEMLQNTQTPEQVIEDASKTINGAIENYNLTN